MDGAVPQVGLIAGMTARVMGLSACSLELAYDPSKDFNCFTKHEREPNDCLTFTHSQKD